MQQKASSFSMEDSNYAGLILHQRAEERRGRLD
jgi:hypothetical protein